MAETFFGVSMIPMNYKDEVRQIKSKLLCFLRHPKDTWRAWQQGKTFANGPDKYFEFNDFALVRYFAEVCWKMQSWKCRFIPGFDKIILFGIKFFYFIVEGNDSIC